MIPERRVASVSAFAKALGAPLGRDTRRVARAVASSSRTRRGT